MAVSWDMNESKTIFVLQNFNKFGKTIDQKNLVNNIFLLFIEGAVVFEFTSVSTQISSPHGIGAAVAGCGVDTAVDIGEDAAVSAHKLICNITQCTNECLSISSSRANIIGRPCLIK